MASNMNWLSNFTGGVMNTLRGAIPSGRPPPGGAMSARSQPIKSLSGTPTTNPINSMIGGVAKMFSPWSMLGPKNTQPLGSSKTSPFYGPIQRAAGAMFAPGASSSGLRLDSVGSSPITPGMKIGTPTPVKMSDINKAVGTGALTLDKPATPSLGVGSSSNPTGIGGWGSPAPTAPRTPTTPPTPADSSIPYIRDPRVQAMLDQTVAQSSLAPKPPAAPPALAGSTGSTGAYNMAGTQSSGQSDLEKYRAAVLAALSPSDAEQALIDQEAQFRGDARLGILAKEGQGRGIPLELVRGQQALLEQQANIQDQTLLDRIAAMSADRQAQLSAAQTQLGYAELDQQQAEAQRQAAEAANQPIEVGGALIRLNPQTGQYETVYSSPNSSSYEPLKVGAGETVIDPTTGQVIYSSPERSTAANAPASVAEYQYAQSQGYSGSYLDFQTAMEAIKNPAGTKSEQKPFSVSAGASIYDPTTGTFTQAPLDPADTQKQNVQQEKLVSLAQERADLVDRILSNPAMYSAVSPFGIASITNINPFDWADRARFVADIKQLINKETFQQLVDIRSQGATLGAISDRELELLQSAATPINSIFDENSGTVNAAINDFKNYLLELKKHATGAIQNAQTSSVLDPSNPDYWLNSFSNDLSTSQNGSLVNVTIGSKPVTVSSSIAQRLAMADADFFRATGQHLQINEALRSHERQADLYLDFIQGRGGRAAPPGQSFHETGKAVDVGNWQQAAPYLYKYGFKNSLPDDRNHFSIGEFA